MKKMKESEKMLENMSKISLLIQTSRVLNGEYKYEDLLGIKLTNFDKKNYKNDAQLFYMEKFKFKNNDITSIFDNLDEFLKRARTSFLKNTKKLKKPYKKPNKKKDFLRGKIK